MTDTDKVKTIQRWSKWFYDHTNTFNGAIGRELAYLWPAIINENVIEVAPNSAIVQLLKGENIDPHIEIWNYLDIRK